MAPHRHGWKTIRAENIVGCTAGLLRFATPAEMDVLIGMLPAEHVRQAARSHGMANRVVLEALLRRGGPGDLDLLVQHALRPGDPPSLLGRLLDLDDPEVNATLLDAVTALGGVPRNLRRQLAHQTSRRDGATPRPLPAATRQDLLSGLGGSGALDHAMLYSADPDMAGTALWFLGAGADPHGAVQACRTLLDAHRGHEIRQLVEQGRLPAFQWGPDGSLPSVLAYAQAALESGQGSGGCATSPTRPARPSSCGRSPRSPTRPGASRGAAGRSSARWCTAAIPASRASAGTTSWRTSGAGGRRRDRSLAAPPGSWRNVPILRSNCSGRWSPITRTSPRSSATRRRYCSPTCAARRRVRARTCW
ncbi:hypothetical protein [Actinomadura madurae]|uniref:hypothetical protein n=1 Tax=Actinomadura madurae TaxID=1993 RepID=UPI0020D22BA7|nr:hypothetical protein [Actinomadura madurae]MCP9968000.1 hypothetical protein [Actinomadura madurae]MCP9980458.1 hypothetical protein [Actinomadura madurae]